MSSSAHNLELVCTLYTGPGTICTQSTACLHTVHWSWHNLCRQECVPRWCLPLTHLSWFMCIANVHSWAICGSSDFKQARWPTVISVLDFFDLSSFWWVGNRIGCKDIVSRRIKNTEVFMKMPWPFKSYFASSDIKELSQFHEIRQWKVILMLTDHVKTDEQVTWCFLSPINQDDYTRSRQNWGVDVNISRVWNGAW